MNIRCLFGRHDPEIGEFSYNWYSPVFEGECRRCHVKLALSRNVYESSIRRWGIKDDLAVAMAKKTEADITKILAEEKLNAKC